MWGFFLRGRQPWVLLAAIGLLIAGCGGFGSGPQVQSALPNQVAAGPGAFLLIQGSNFARNATARVGASALGNVTWVNDHLLTAELPPGMAPGAYDLTVSNGGSASSTLRQAIRVQSATQAQPAAPSAPTQASRSAQPAPSARSASATQTAAQPATQAATRPPASAPTPAPTSANAPRAPTQAPLAATPNIAGTWSIVDIVLYGPGSGGSYPFTITIQQSGNQISGSGDGLALRGVIAGNTVTASYSQSNGSTGTFTWTVDPSGSTMQGRFDNSIGNGGSSTGQRTAGDVVFGAAALPARGPVIVPPGPSHGKGKGH